MIGLRVALGLFAGGTITLAYAFVSKLLPAERLGLSFSAFASCAMLGGSAGPMSLGVIAQFSLRLPLVVGASAFALCLVLLLRVQRPRFGVPGRAPVPETESASGEPSNRPTPAPRRATSDPGP